MFKHLVQRRENARRFPCKRVLEGKAVAVQEHPVQVEHLPEILVLLYIAVAAVADDGVIEVGEVFADLVAAARFQLGGHE